MSECAVGERVALRRARVRLGLTQEQAAEALWVSMTTWSRWERGVQGVRPAYRARMAQIFGVKPAEIEHWLDGDGAPVETEIWPMPDFADVSPEHTVRSAVRLWRCDVDAERRQMLVALPFVPAALGDWLSEWSHGRPAAPVARGGSPAVGGSDADRVMDAWRAFNRMDHQFGAGLVRPAIVDYLHTQVAPLLRGRYDERVGAKLMTAATAMTQIAGWTAFDLGRHGQAQHYYGQALRLAKLGGDRFSAAWVLTALTHQAIYLEEPVWATRLARAALDTARQADAPPRVLSLLLGREAWAMSLRAASAETRDAHTEAAAVRLLGEAEHAYGQGPTDRDPHWVAWYQPTEPVAEGARCWTLIGRHRRAAGLLESVLPQYDESRSRSAQLTRISLAEAHLAAGELDQAIDAARAAVPGARALTSTRLNDRITHFAKALRPYKDTVHAREFTAYLRSR
ncbi:helix-turn-helix transcriptional regulator [Spongiactinospora sp. TRM90649]|uniref:helix-turn-helix domain-containing protein n=1 Tax=Spongiactinospora sp. TRM90649 TaxID=3031114 RepID=UPI0023FA0E4B|nr:helix-turn-helix transcriptional regulator [Spongiactinospora sp. TRM90649]MDF5754722.1 helix-turn-helix transcriptional regulator [Spongiactinospora sp. TRM90649]